MWLLIFQKIAFDTIVDLFYFPLWWYSGGALHSLKWCYGFFLDGNKNLAPGLWLKNLFVPMYGQYDWEGRIISFFMRLAQLCFRSIALLFWMMICIGLFFVWLLIPIVLVVSFVRLYF